MNHYIKYSCLVVTVLLVCRYIYSTDHNSVQPAVSEASDVSIKHTALILVSKSQCCGSHTGCHQCVPGTQSCISQAIRAKYCLI